MVIRDECKQTDSAFHGMAKNSSGQLKRGNALLAEPWKKSAVAALRASALTHHRKDRYLEMPIHSSRVSGWRLRWFRSESRLTGNL
jgi:hypothetical protein